MASARTVTLDDDATGERPRWLLTVVDHRDPALLGRRVEVPEGEALTLGRDAALDAAILDDPGVSRRHARVEAGVLSLAVADLGSHNGTWHDGERVTAATLASGDVLRVGSVTFVARRVSRPPWEAVGAGFPAFSEPMARVAEALRAVDRGAVLLRGRPFAGVDAVAAALAARVDPVAGLLALPVVTAGDAGPLLARAVDRVVLVGPLPLADAVWQDDLLTRGARRARLAVLWWPDRSGDDGVARAALVRSLDAREVELPPLSQRPEDLPHLVRAACVRAHGRAPRLHHGLLVAMLRARWDDDLRALEDFARAHLAPAPDDAPLARTPAMDSALRAEAPVPAVRLSTAARVVVVARDARWLRAPGEESVSLADRRALVRVLRALVDARVERPGRSLEVEEIVAIAWAGQRLVGDSGPHRVHVAVSTLRRLGLGEALARDDRGYLLDPRATEVADDSG